MAFISEAARFTRDSGNIGSVSTTYLDAYPAGTLILLAVNAPVVNVWTTMTVTDNAGNTYTMIGSPRQDMPANYQVAQFSCVLTNPVTTSTTITATASDRNPDKWVILAAAFDDSAASLDVHTSAANTSSAPNSGNVTPSASGQLLFGAIAYTDNTGALGLTPAAGWTNLTKGTASPSANGRTLVIGYRYINSLSDRSYSGTLPSSQAWAALVAGFNLGSNPIATYQRSYQVVIDATGSTNPTLTQDAGPTAAINATSSPIFVITEPASYTTSMSFSLTAVDGGENVTETIIIDPRGNNESGRLVWDGTSWV
jgi:hypothetical protein